MIKLKEIDVLNDYVAVLRTMDIPDGLLIEQEQADKISNEGIVVGTKCFNGLSGFGPMPIALGDRVIFRRVKYHELQPQSGGYEGKSVLIMKHEDLLVRIGKSDKYEFERIDRTV